MMIRFFAALLLCLSLPAVAADQAAPPNRFGATLVPVERFDVGATLVERHGQRGSPMILIPGLASGAWVWQETVRRFMSEHTVYVLTLPGFDGRPAAPEKTMAAAQASLRDLITSRKLHKPVLVGHSLGGMLALQLAEQNPDLVGAVVSIDGLPLFPGTEAWAKDQRGQMGASIAAHMKSDSPAAFAAQQQQYMRGIGVTDMARADELALLTAKSDPASVTRYMVDTITLDLRPSLAAIKAPVLLISPYFDADDMQQQMSEADKSAYYTSLMQGTPNLKVVSVSPARHFAMFDQPQKVNEAISAFVASLPH